MIIDLNGRRAIVTGSTAGIGRATAEGLARAGASVVVSGRRGDRVDAAVRQVREAFPEPDISGVAADLSTAEGAEAFFAQAPDADILVNNLGTAILRKFADTTDEVANVVVYLCSEQASATTGAALRVDDGVVRFVA